MLTPINAYLNGLRLSNIYNLIYLRAFEKAVAEERKDEEATTVIHSGNKGTPFPDKLESIYNRWLENVDNELEGELKSEHFTSLLSRYVQSLIELRSSFRKVGYPIDYLDWMFDWYVKSRMVFSSIPKESHLAPFDVVYRKGKARLLHYRKNDQETTSSSSTIKKQRQPLLIIYAPINTFHILDLNPKRSVVRDLLASGGLDIYLLDWGHPDSSDNHLSLEDYLGYVKDAVKVVKDQTRADKISILGYCWGGIFALIHAALNPEEVRNMVLMAVPVDFSKDDTILARWSRTIDVDSMMDEFGHMDGQVLDLGFLMRNPPRYGFDKYLKLFQRSYDREFVDTFMDVERWLYDTPPIPGALHRQIIKYCYRDNLLISGGIEVLDREGRKQKKVDIQKNITMPVLSVIAQQDDIVSTASSLAINDHISSKDKSVLENPGGHVALCISNTAHKKLWPEAAKWLLSR
jgi:polyhydroxyalkanoate synthase subunit PhaC